MPFAPGDAWPSDTPGGAVRDEWSGYVKVWVLAAIAAGNVWRLGPDPFDALDSGNCIGGLGDLAGGETPPDTLPTVDGLWVDVTCDLVDLELRQGATTIAGVRSKTEAATLVATLYDPTAKYDPLNPSTPFALGARSRLIPGAAVRCFVEVIDDPASSTVTVSTFELFTGTADSFAEDWTKEPSDRRCVITATDRTKDYVRLERDPQTPAGGFDSIIQRLTRIADYFALPHPTLAGPFDVIRHLAATDLTKTAWQQFADVIENELGFMYFTGDGTLTWISRAGWRNDDPIVLTIGSNQPGAQDVVTAAEPSAFDANVLNAVTAQRTGGTVQPASNAPSQLRFGEKSTNVTGLDLSDDLQVLAWAQDLVTLEAFPRQSVARVTIFPKVAVQPWETWADLFSVRFVLDQARILYVPPRFDYTVDLTVRVVGLTHHVTASAWSLEWRTISANMALGATAFTLGPDPHDLLDAGNVLV